MLKIAKGVKVPVSLIGLTVQGLFIVDVVNSVFRTFGYDTLITGMVEGTHKPGSKHYIGNAVDFEKDHIPLGIQSEVLNAIKDCLSPEFDVVLETTHIHVEFDPKRGPNVAG